MGTAIDFQEWDWADSHNGLFHCPLHEAHRLMPEIYPALVDWARLVPPGLRGNWTIDVKVHMLMPNQYPCIPGWHYDMVPRGVDGKQDFSKICDDKMYLWVSGGPLTEFEDGFVEPGKWRAFTQRDKHRGTMSTEHCWRCFIRICPRSILEPAPEGKWLRRHSQVYLNADDFTW